MQASGTVLILLLCIAMFAVKETVSAEEEETEVEFRTGTPQREPEDKRLFKEPDGHLILGEHEVEFATNKINDMDTSETHHFRRRMRIRSRFGVPPFGGFGGGFGSGFGGIFPFASPLLGILGLFA